MQTQKRESFVRKLFKKTSRRGHQHRPSDSTITLHFRLRKPIQDFPGESIHICGSIPELGSGSIELAPLMEPKSDSLGNYWSYDVVVPLQELELSRKEKAESFDGNPQGHFFTYNFVAKQEINGAMSKFEEIPRRGLSNSAVMDASGKKNLRELTLDQTWNISELPMTPSLMHKKTPELKDQPMEDRLKGKSSGQSESPLSPSFIRRDNSSPAPLTHRPMSFHEMPTSSVSSSVSSPSVSSPPVSTPAVTSSTTSTPDSVKRKTNAFRWYRTLTGKEFRKDPKSRRSTVVETPSMMMEKDISTGLGFTDFNQELPPVQEGVVSRTDFTRQRSSSLTQPGSRSPVVLQQSFFNDATLVDPSFHLSPSKRRSEQLVSDQVHKDLITLSPIPAFKAPQRTASAAMELERDPLTTATTPRLSTRDFVDLAPMSILEHQAIADLEALESSPIRSELPLDLTESATMDVSTLTASPDMLNGSMDMDAEAGEEILMDRLSESVPLLTADSEQLPEEDTESLYDNIPVLQTSTDITHIQVSESEREAMKESMEKKVDPVLFGKWHRVGQELKGILIQPKIAVLSTSDVLDSTPVPSTSLDVPMSPIAVQDDAMEQFPLVDLTFPRRVSSDFVRMEEEERASRMSHGVDPVLSGRWRNLGKESSKMILSRFTDLKKSFSDHAQNLMDSVTEFTSMIPSVDTIDQAVASIILPETTPLATDDLKVESIPEMIPSIVVDSPVEERKIDTDESKTVNIYEEQSNNQLIHRRWSDVASPRTPNARGSPYTVGYHRTRRDFMPITHSISQTAVDTPIMDTNSRRRNLSFAVLAVIAIIFIWFFLFGSYFPESMMVEMGPSSPSELVVSNNADVTQLPLDM